MSSLGSLHIQLNLDTASFGKELSKSEYQARKFARNFELDLDKATNAARQFSNRTTEYLSNIEKAAKNINKNSSFDFLTKLGGYAQSVGGTVVQLSNQYTELSNKLKLVSDSEAEQVRAMQAVYDISLKTAQSTEATSSVYQTFAQNAKQLGISQNEVARLTETVSKAVAISGASSAVASNALVQFSQALLMGKLKAQEFNSLMTQTPSVIQAIARGLGLTTAQLKAMVDKGEITAEKMVEGLKKAESSVDQLYGKTATTIGGAFQNIQTATEKWVGEMDNAIGVSSNFVAVMNSVANNLSVIAPILLNLGIAWGAVRLGQRTKESIILTQATLQKAKASRTAAQATLSQVQQELAFSRTSLQSLSAQLQLARTEQERTIIRQRMKAQSAEIIALTNAEAVATQNLANAKKSANVLSGAMAALGGPIGIATIAISGLAMAGYEWYQRAEEIRQKHLEFVNTLDELNNRITAMSALELKVSSADTQDSIEAQKKQINELEEELIELQKTAKETVIVFSDGLDTSEFEKSAKVQRREADAVARKTLELQQAKENLAKTEASLAVQMDQLPIAELRDRFVELFPNIEQSQIKVDGLNVSIGNFTLAMPSASAEALKFSGAVGTLAKTALQAAVAIVNLNNLGGGQLGEKATKFIETNKKRIEINRLRTLGKNSEADKIQAELDIAGMELSGLDYSEALKSQVALLASNRIKTGIKKGSSKSPKPKKDKVAEKAKREAERSSENYNHQLIDMQQRLAELKANASDIALFGQPSQYQELKKLTEDITLNADKYKGYGIEGVARLKEMATQMDQALQQVAIAQLSYDNSAKLDAMEFELTLLGKTRQEAELLQYNHQLDLEAAKLKIGMSEENIAKLDEEIAKLKERRAEIQQQSEQKRTSWENWDEKGLLGIKNAWDQFETDAMDVAGNVGNVMGNTLNGMSNALTDFVTTGKADFRGFAQSVLKDISAMLVKMALFNAIKQGLSAFGYSDGGLVGSSFAVGGYTGDGGKYTPAGIVHKGEYVITKEATSRIGLDYLNYLNYGRRGFASGGGVAVPRVPSINQQLANNGEIHNSVTVTVNIDKNGNTESSVEQQAQQGKQLGNLIQAKVLEVLSRERRAGGMLAH